MKVCVGVPSMDIIHTNFAWAFMHLGFDAVHNGIDLRIANERSCYVEVSRNKIVKGAQEVNADYLLFLDSDMGFPKDALRRLLAHGKDVVGCNYIRRTPPYNCTTVGLDGKTILPGRTGLEEVFAVPTGVLLIKMSVFDTIPKPWFQTHYQGEKMIGEDVHFCYKLRHFKIPVFCDHDLSREIEHFGVMGYNLSHIEEESDEKASL